MTGVVEQFGALGIFMLMVPESACIPIPSELTLLFSGFAVHQGWITLPLAVLAATAGNVVGSLLAYGLGASRLIDRIPIARSAMDRCDRLLARQGTRAVFLARLLPLARTFVSLPAGARRIRLDVFLALTTAGCALWALGFVLIGMFAGAAWTDVGAAFDRGLLIAVIFVLALMLVRKRAR